MAFEVGLGKFSDHRLRWTGNAGRSPIFTSVVLAGRTRHETYGDDNALLPNPVHHDAVVRPMIPASALKDGLLDAGAVEDSLWYRLRERIAGKENKRV